jgi:hypothetical protein
MPACLFCGKPFTAYRAWQRFCPGGTCRIAYHNREKIQHAVRLTPDIFDALAELARAHDCPVSEMACRILYQSLNPDWRPLEEEAIYGKASP